MNSAPHGLQYTELKKRLANNALRLSEVPEEHFVSLPLPTRRWAGGAYASFASPARRQPGQPLELDPPDRWWAASARRGAIAVYALQTAIPYADVAGWSAVTVPPRQGSVAQHREALATIDELLDQLATEVLAGNAGENRSRRALQELLGDIIPEATAPWYRALTPDFFAWLEAEQGPGETPGSASDGGSS